MKRILIFSGTTEGRRLAEMLAAAGMKTVVCVATEYGEQVMKPLPGAELHVGRMDCSQMQAFMKKENFLAVVDATHPFATEVSENIRQSADLSRLDYFRLKRDTKASLEHAENISYFDTNEECLRALCQTEGNILLTTGSKELAAYCKDEELKSRLYVRILPTEESISACKEQGLSGRQMIAMQGPFGTDLNRALIRQFAISVLVSKESGSAGGFEEKMKAALQTGILMYVIRNPEKQEGASFDELCAHFMKLSGQGQIENSSLAISLIGIGMGDEKSLTIEAKETIKQADYIFGARRLLAAATDWNMDLAEKSVYPYYRGEEIIPKLGELWQEGRKKAAVLFSGDSGFYSGTGALYQSLSKWREERGQDISIKLLPGISSVSYFAAACKTDWQDAKLISIHGKTRREDWAAEVLDSVIRHEKVMLLVSGAGDVRSVGNLLCDNGLADRKIIVGYQLSYPNESVWEYTPDECRQITEEGLYTLLICNKRIEKKFLAPCRKDQDFIRGQVPMTKEEIRALAICKLRLTKDAVVYDIGSGTGSVAVEIAERSAAIKVYAIEQKEEAVTLMRENKAKFKLPNLEILHAKAPEIIETLPVGTHAFIGGSSGKLESILKALRRKNPSMRIVLTAISLETIGELTGILKTMPVIEEEIIQLQVSRAKEAGSYHLMQSENPVSICSFCFADTGCEA